MLGYLLHPGDAVPSPRAQICSYVCGGQVEGSTGGTGTSAGVLSLYVIGMLLFVWTSIIFLKRSV